MDWLASPPFYKLCNNVIILTIQLRHWEYLCMVMRFVFLILLLCGIIGQATIRTAWTIQYQMNRAEYLAKCVNKDKPKLHCNGQCAFMKEIAAREKSQEPLLPESFQLVKDLQLFFEPVGLPYLTLEITGRKNIPLSASWALLESPLHGIIKPPAWSESPVHSSRFLTTEST